MNWLIIAAGGNGTRMGFGMNKIFAKINNKPIIYWTLKNFEDNRLVDKIIISAKPDDFQSLKKIIKKNNFKKIIKIILAEKSRQESTFKVLKWLKSRINKNDLVGVHNAVNPFVFNKEIEEVYKSAKKYGAALLAKPAKDTIKITDKNLFISTTPLRETVWHAQTPQVAIFHKLYKAFVKADKDNFLGTDDTQLLERINLKAKIIHCNQWNFKITFPEELILARRVLEDFNKKNV